MFNYDCTIVPLIIFGILHLTEKDAVLPIKPVTYYSHM